MLGRNKCFSCGKYRVPVRDRQKLKGFNCTYSFPRNNPKVYAQWLKVFGISEVYEKREHPRICEKCFKPECFYEKYPGQNRKSLLPGAVPTNNKKMTNEADGKDNEVERLVQSNDNYPSCSNGTFLDEYSNFLTSEENALIQTDTTEQKSSEITTFRQFLLQTQSNRPSDPLESKKFIVESSVLLAIRDERDKLMDQVRVLKKDLKRKKLKIKDIKNERSNF